MGFSFVLCDRFFPAATAWASKSWSAKLRDRVGLGDLVKQVPASPQLRLKRCSAVPGPFALVVIPWYLHPLLHFTNSPHRQLKRRLTLKFDLLEQCFNHNPITVP